MSQLAHNKNMYNVRLQNEDIQVKHHNNGAYIQWWLQSSCKNIDSRYCLIGYPTYHSCVAIVTQTQVRLDIIINNRISNIRHQIDLKIFQIYLVF